MLNVPLDEVKALLQSVELAQVEQAIASRVGLRILPAEFATPYKRLLDLAEVSPGIARDLLVRERDALVSFGVLVVQGSSVDPDGEFPPGEEPGPHDRSRQVGQPLGLANGTGLLQLCHYVLAQGDQDRLLRFLELAKVPRRKRFAIELRRYYERASGRTRS